jgi:hypothetical protein
MRDICLLGLLLLFFLFSCQGDKKTKDITRLVNEWQGKEIVFPENMVFTRYLTDTTDYRIPQSEYRVLVYVDSIGCTSCKLQLSRWKELIAYADSLIAGAVPFLFFFHSKDYQEIRYLLKVDGFGLPVCIDREDRLNKLNRFPSDMTFQTFLLDKDNKVVVIGNPIHNLAVKELYIKHISGQISRASSGGQTRTTIIADVSDIDMGTLATSETRQAVFRLQNTGNNPLVIFDTAVTCGCAVVSYDKFPAAVGESLEVRVNMTPKKSGFFSETITVKTNTEQYIKLTIRGQAQ